ncbi:CcdB family protein [Roseomonas marmotae]|uniref:Toxin CcdB n=1 Tax=Roseomonas marmotae TaxID=2768161 RepID=A0ABS3KHX6_9PROT|nr:CcdB family protein [Roseomonas marmotae]MBO1077062.1 CcdB family protein [Roseomonas marmotae]QTI81883.1 CcdB family protein [Roseomonas marmotae]
MPQQFGVFRNPGRNKAVIPYVLVVQSNRFRHSGRRVVVPLISARSFAPPESDIGPRFIIGGEGVVLDPLQVTNVPAAVLGDPVASLEQEEERIVRALDVMMSTAWR